MLLKQRVEDKKETIPGEESCETPKCLALRHKENCHRKPVIWTPTGRKNKHKEQSAVSESLKEKCVWKEGSLIGSTNCEVKRKGKLQIFIGYICLRSLVRIHDLLTSFLRSPHDHMSLGLSPSIFIHSLIEAGNLGVLIDPTFLYFLSLLPLRSPGPSTS